MKEKEKYSKIQSIYCTVNIDDFWVYRLPTPFLLVLLDKFIKLVAKKQT